MEGHTLNDSQMQGHFGQLRNSALGAAQGEDLVRMSGVL